MIDSATYWVEEFHVDGFRFDLQKLHDRGPCSNWPPVRAINPSINLHGEGWDMGTLPSTNAIPGLPAVVAGPLGKWSTPLPTSVTVSGRRDSAQRL